MPLSRPSRRGRPLRPLVGAGLALLAVAGCSASQSALDPQGPAAERIAGVWWVMLWIGLAIYVVVLALLAVPLWRRARARGAGAGERPPPTGAVGTAMVWIGGVVVPIVVLVVLVVISGVVAAGVHWDSAPEDPAVTIDVTGRMFWWEVRYQDEGFETANEIVIPVGRPVHLRLTSTDVIHSFWVPPLHGKIDLMPGHGTALTIEASEAGSYRGRCAEYCGLSHARMSLVVHAYEEQEFDAWVAAQAEPAAEIGDEATRAGREVFTSASCVYCHTVRGHGPVSDVGPDLTHLASRGTIAAGTLPNTRGHLGGWILNPQALKPGNRMPATDISSTDLQVLLDYLERLQ